MCEFNHDQTHLQRLRELTNELISSVEVRPSWVKQERGMSGESTS